MLPNALQVLHAIEILIFQHSTAIATVRQNLSTEWGNEMVYNLLCNPTHVCIEGNSCNRPTCSKEYPGYN